WRRTRRLVLCWARESGAQDSRTRKATQCLRNKHSPARSGVRPRSSSSHRAYIYLEETCSCRLRKAVEEFRVIATTKHVTTDPFRKPFAVAGDLIPSKVKSVIPRVVAKRIGRVSTRWHFGNRCDNPVRQNDCIHRRIEGLDDFLNRGNQRLRRQRRLFLS